MKYTARSHATRSKDKVAIYFDLRSNLVQMECSLSYSVTSPIPDIRYTHHHIIVQAKTWIQRPHQLMPRSFWK